MDKTNIIEYLLITSMFLFSLTLIQASSTSVEFIIIGEMPDSILNLQMKEKSPNSILWQWENPSENFEKTIIYLNKQNIANTTNEFYNATNLKPETEYTITIHTYNLGAINNTPVSDTIKTHQKYEEDDKEEKPITISKRPTKIIGGVNYYPEEPIKTEIVSINLTSEDKIQEERTRLNLFYLIIPILIIAILITLLAILKIY